MTERNGDAGNVLGWQDIHALGRALAATYADSDRLNADDAELKRLIAALPGFHDNTEPPAHERLQDIRFAWLAASEPEDDDGRYDYFL